MAEISIQHTWIIRHASALLRTRKRGQLIKPKRLRLTHRAFPGVWLYPDIYVETDGATSFIVSVKANFDTDSFSTPGSVWLEWKAHLYVAGATPESGDVPYGDGWYVGLREYTPWNGSEFSRNGIKREDFLKAERNNGDVHLRFDLKIIHFSQLLKQRNLLRRALWNSGANSSDDFQIRVNGESFNVHQSILVESSPVFASMLAADMREQKDRFVDLTNTTNLDAVDALIKAVYRESLNFSIDLQWTIDVLELAERYQFKEVKTDCEEALIALTTADNVLSILVVADKYRAAMVMNFGINLIASDDTIMESDEWREFQTDVGTKDLALKISDGVIRKLRDRHAHCVGRKRRKLS